MKISNQVSIGLAAVVLSMGMLAPSATATEGTADDVAAPEVLPGQPSASVEDFSLSPELQEKDAAVLAGYCSTYVNLLPPGGGPVDYYRLPANSSNSLNCVMESGVTGYGVWVLQLALNACYGRGLVADGDFGPATRSALMYVQSLHGIGVDGVYGPQTLNAMRWPKTATGANCLSGSSF